MIFFIGIKGTGMAALATMLKDIGEMVSGSDLPNHFFTEDELIKRDIPIYDFSPANIKDNMTVIIGNAFQEDFPEVVAARNNPTITCYRYHEYLGLLMKKYKTVAISGSHGKTTTTTMTRDVLSKFYSTGYLIGDGEGYLQPDSQFLCVEADEFRRHFMSYYPDYALITNIEIDHVDYFKDEDDYFSAYQDYVKQVKEGVFYNGDDTWCQKLVFEGPHFSFGFSTDNDFYPDHLEETSDGASFDFMFKGQYVAHYNLPFSEKHLMYDAMAVLSLATVFCLDARGVEEAFRHYESPKRRFKVEECADSVFVDDYAHHPTEVAVTLETAAHRYPNRELIAIFKPHRASRVYHFADDFKKALSKADVAYLLDFTSIDDKQDGVDIDIHYLADKMDNAKVLSEDEEGAQTLAKHKGACYVFMSSKDIYHLAEKTKNILKNEQK